jgi:alpha-beta hydrolase superfamily lysophospholipase
MFLARILGFFTPNAAIETKLDTDGIFRDPAKAEARNNDKLYHNRMGLRVFTQIVDAGIYIINNAAHLTLPVLLLSGGSDRIVCSKSIRETAERAGSNITFHEEPEGRHALRDETEPARSEILKRMLDFCGDKP